MWRTFRVGGRACWGGGRTQGAHQRLFKPQISQRWQSQSHTGPEGGGERHSWGRFSPFVDTPGRTFNLLKAYSFYYAHPHPEITPHLFLTSTLFNELGAIGVLSHQMRNYPHRILPWTDQLVDTLPSFTASELKVLDEPSLDLLRQRHKDPLQFLISRRLSLIASALYTVKDFAASRFASERSAFAGVEFTSDELPYGGFLEIARSDAIDNPIQFHDSPKALIKQYLDIVQLPREELVRCGFPLCYWNLWWSLFYLTGDTAPVIAVATTLSNYMNQHAEDDGPSPILAHARQQLTTNAYQHSMVYSALQALMKKNPRCQWLDGVLRDVDQLMEAQGPFKLTMYEQQAPLIPSLQMPLLLEHFPAMQISLSSLLPPTPHVVMHEQVQETLKQARARGFVLPNGDYDDEVMVNALAGLWTKHTQKEELAGHTLEEAITPTHDLIFHTLELMAASRTGTSISTLHALAKLCVLYQYQGRPESYMNGKVTPSQTSNMKAVYWYRKLLDMQPKEPLLNYELGMFFKDLGMYSDALGLLEKALRLEDADVGTPLMEVMGKLGITMAYEDDE